MTGAGESTGRHRVGDIVWWAGVALVGLIALSAIAGFVQLFVEIWGSGPDPGGLAWLGIATLLAAAALGGLAIVLVLARRGHDGLAAAIGIAALVIVRAIAIGAIQTPLTTDWADYHDQAINLAAGGAFGSARSPGWPLALSLLYRIGGPSPILGELFDLGCAVGVGIALYLLARRSIGPVAAVAGLYLWSVSPGPALFTVVLASEHLYTLLFTIAIGLAVVALGRRWFAWIPVGIVLALAHDVRPAGLVVLPAFLALPFLVGLPRRQAAGGAATIAIAFAIVLGPTVLWQYQRFGQLTLSSSNYDGFNLLVGLNVDHEGHYNRDDEALVGATPSTLEFRERSYRLAIERLTGHPESVAIIALPKFQSMWGDSRYGTAWTMAPGRPGQPRLRAALTVLSQAAYAATVILAAIFLVVRRHERDPVAWLIILCVGAVAVSEIFLEVQSRYHAPFEPLFCLLAGGAVAWLVEWRRRGVEPSV